MSSTTTHTPPPVGSPRGEPSESTSCLLRRQWPGALTLHQRPLDADETRESRGGKLRDGLTAIAVSPGGLGLEAVFPEALRRGAQAGRRDFARNEAVIQTPNCTSGVTPPGITRRRPGAETREIRCVSPVEANTGGLPSSRLGLSASAELQDGVAATVPRPHVAEARQEVKRNSQLHEVALLNGGYDEQPRHRITAIRGGQAQMGCVDFES
jgi:hypothetical protein